MMLLHSRYAHLCLAPTTIRHLSIPDTAKYGRLHILDTSFQIHGVRIVSTILTPLAVYAERSLCKLTAVLYSGRGLLLLGNIALERPWILSWCNTGNEASIMDSAILANASEIKFEPINNKTLASLEKTSNGCVVHFGPSLRDSRR